MNISPQRYNIAAITLHWVMAVAFFAMIVMGLVMVHLQIEKSLQFRMYQWHKSLGILLFLAFFLRLLIRVISNKPELPNSISPLERKASTAGHWALYICMFLVPLSGWLMVSSSVYGLPTFVFGWFEWPHIPYVGSNVAIEDFAKESHEYLAYAFILLIGIHIAATIKHWIFDKINLLPRMGIGKIKQGDK